MYNVNVNRSNIASHCSLVLLSDNNTMSACRISNLHYHKNTTYQVHFRKRYFEPDYICQHMAKNTV